MECKFSINILYKVVIIKIIIINWYNSQEFNNENILIQQILNKTVIGRSDTSVKDETMVSKWIITIINNEKVNEGHISSTN